MIPRPPRFTRTYTRLPYTTLVRSAHARGQQRRLVDEVGEIGAREAGRAASDSARIDVGRQRHFLHMHGENLLATLDIRTRHDDLAVEAARTQQRRIEHVGPRSEEHTSELQSLMRNSYAVFCL